MHALPFQHIRHVEEMLREVDLEHLVLILSAADRGRYQLVYNAPPPVAPFDARWSTSALSDLVANPALYANFDGPVIGFAALELLLSDLPTYGVNFYLIDRLFERHGQLAMLHRNGYRLARTLAEYLRQQVADKRQTVLSRSYARVIELALPNLLAGQPLDQLVAVVFNGGEDDLLDPNSCQLLYNDRDGPADLRYLPQRMDSTGECWVVTFEELYLFHPRLPRSAMSDLRVMLRRMDLRQTQQHTCRRLALRCWDEWQATGHLAFRAAAYSLAAEAWLIDEDVEDLVALVPHRDFARFAETGDALHIYRVPVLTLGQRHGSAQCTVADLLHWPEDDRTYATSALSLPVLAPMLQRISPTEARDIIDLGTVLWKANRMADAARTFWLLSRDLLYRPASREAPSSVWAWLAPSPQTITDLAIRAALIYSLGDPWRWRQGRYEIFLRDCYAHVMDCLLYQAKHSESSLLAHYYQALSAWYGYAAAADPVRNLSDLVRACRAFQENYQLRDVPEREYAVVEQLIEIGERFLFPDREHDTYLRAATVEASEAFPVTAYLHTIMDSQQLLGTPSDLFGPPFRAYSMLHARWLRVQRSLHTNRPALGELNDLLTEYRHLQRITHLPHHELAILSRAYADDIERIERLRRAGNTEPMIRIALRNPWITLHTRERLILRVENSGGSHAEQLRLTLYRSNGFDLLSASDLACIETLAPGARWRVEYEIRAKEAELVIQVVWSYHDHAGQSYTQQETLRPETRQMTAVRAKPLGNPYEVGRPVSGATGFFGRLDELEQILSRLSKGSTQPILLRGPRRIGKTSLIKRIAEVLSNRAQRQQLELAPDLEIRLSAIFPIAVSLQAIDPAVESYNAYFLQLVVREINKILGIGATPALSTDLADWRLPAHTFLEQVDWILSQRPVVRLLVLIDEWDEISHEKFRDLGRNLRHIVQEEQRISWVFSSTWALTAEIGRFGSPWFNILDRIEIKAMDWEAATRLITVLSDTVSVEWIGEAVVAVLEQTGRRPYLIQLLCSRIIDYLIRRNRRVVEPEMVEIVINAIISDTQVTEQYLGFLWGDASWMGHLIIWVLDRSLPTQLTERAIQRTLIAEYRRRTGQLLRLEQFDREFDEQMTWLRSVADALALSDDQYSFSFPLVQRWLHHVIAQREEHITRAFERLAVEPRDER